RGREGPGGQDGRDSDEASGTRSNTERANERGNGAQRAGARGAKNRDGRGPNPGEGADADAARRATAGGGGEGGGGGAG
ncbi:hypothetical protein C3R44_22460, partial [Mycobacterium tuberculosis]